MCSKEMPSPTLLTASEKHRHDVQDEVLSHRLGLIPVKIDPDLFESKESGLPAIPSGRKSHV